MKIHHLHTSLPAVTMKEQPHVVGFIFGCEDHDFLIFCAEGFKV